jgi:protein-tyrosine phosphatase
MMTHRRKPAMLSRVRTVLDSRYGGPRGCALHFSALGRYYLGAWRQCRAIDWARVRRLVFVCMGNVCRSPYAAGRAEQLGLESLSFGLDVRKSAPADAVAQVVAAQRSVDLSPYRSQPLQPGDLRDTDLVVLMEPGHLRTLKQLAPEIQCQTTLLGLWCPSPHPHVFDPLGRSAEYFAECYSLIDNGLRRMVELLIEHMRSAK